jgi:hypothetical protein
VQGPELKTFPIIKKKKRRTKAKTKTKEILPLP